MKPVLLQTLPAFRVVRDAAFLGEDTLLLTDPLANLWRFTLENGQVRLLHRGEDIMALFREGIVPAGGGYPRLAVSPRGDAPVSKPLPGQTDVRFSPSGRRFITLGPTSSNPYPMQGEGGGTTVTLWGLEA